ncbi:MAG: ribulose-phosphate 3-epimerase [Bacteroidales bacterium]|nr:ribulose-phosphate 3-epimerase [Bacteroidales bacterium]MDT8429957.1 ribulose-phosphate 3-epimerase [Bacteroidales bacterium]
MKHQIAPSILNADFLRLSEVIHMLNQSEADLIHLDIMDGVFVPNLSFGFPIISQINEMAEKPLDVHLMITEPDRYLERFRDAGADLLTVHYEACHDLHATLKEISALGMKPSVSLKPETDVSVLQPYLPNLDMVLIMTVEPGYGGQSFMEESYGRVQQLRDMIRKAGVPTVIEVDGGIGRHNLHDLKDAGASVFVIGTSIFRADDPAAMISELKHM